MRLLKWILPAWAAVCLLIPMTAAAGEGLPRVRISTTLGDIVVELEEGKAPVTVQNFLRYVDSGFYSGTIFHRVIDRFMIQGGGFTTEMRKKTNTYPAIPLESRNGLKNKRFTVAMARTGAPDSATSQFFINVVDNPRLDFASSEDGQGYAVFGQVIEGTDVVDKIRAVPTTTRAGREDVPIDEIVIQSIERVQGEGAAGRAR